MSQKSDLLRMALKTIFCFFAVLLALDLHAQTIDCFDSIPSLDNEAEPIRWAQNAIVKSLREKQLAAKKKHTEHVADYFKTLTLAEQNQLKDIFEKIHQSPNGLISLISGQGDPIFLIHGIDEMNQNPYVPEWVKTFELILKTKRPVFFYKWSISESMDSHQAKVAAELKQLLEKQSVEILGYSAGGVIGILAFDALSPEARAKAKLHTVASPIFGYEAPAYAYIAAPFTGRAKIDIGRGAYRKLKNNKFSHCEHWVTGDCELDLHACKVGSTYPQTGSTEDTPCGIVRMLVFESHSSSLGRAAEEIFILPPNE